MTQWAMRTGTAGVLVFLLVVGAASSSRSVGASAPLVLVGVLATVTAVTPASRLGEWPPPLALALIVPVVVVLCGPQPANVGRFGLCVVIAWGAYIGGAYVALALTVLSWAGLALQLAVVADSADGGWAPWFAGTLFTAVVALLVDRDRRLLAELRAAQAGLADQARAEERQRIAREMHDVIGHALTVSLLHVGSARLALDDDPEDARANLAEAERLARRSLAEVRAAVGLMREDPGGNLGADITPLPGAGDLGELVQSFRRAGTSVTCTVVGDPGGLPATWGLTLYRILQEALTNAVRHAPGAPVSVRVEIVGAAASLTVDSDGAPGPVATDGTGVAGMRERAVALGGRLEAGPWQGGWRVEAVLP